MLKFQKIILRKIPEIPKSLKIPSFIPDILSDNEKNPWFEGLFYFFIISGISGIFFAVKFYLCMFKVIEKY